MSVRVLDGFDTYGSVADMAQKWIVTNSGTGLSFVSGRAGDDGILPAGQALQWAASQVTTKVRRPIGGVGGIRTIPDIFIFGFNIKIGSLPVADTEILYLGHETDFTSGGIEITSTGALNWSRSTTTLRTTTAQITAGSWHHIEVRVECEDGAAAAILEIAIDGVNQDWNTDGNKQLFGGDPVDTIHIGPSAAMGLVSIDDFYILYENDGVDPFAQLGETQISTLYPTADGNTSAWTRFDGANDWESIDEGEGVGQDGDTTYISSQTTGQQSLFEFGDLDAQVSSVDAAVVNVIARKVGLGGPGFHTVKRTGTTTVVDTGEVQGAAVGSYVVSAKAYTTDGESVAFTPTTINSIEFGVEVE